VLPIAVTKSVTELGAKPKMVGLIHTLLISRMVTATLGTSTQTRLVNRGTRKEVYYYCKVVADDVAIIFNGKYPQTLCDLMIAKLKILSEWTIENGLGVNPSKTEVVLFTNRYKIPQLNPPILISLLVTTPNTWG